MAAKFPEEFFLESYFNKYEFSVAGLLCSSDSESITINELNDLQNSDELKRIILNTPLGYGKFSGDKELIAEVAKLYPGLTEDNIVEVVPSEGIYIGLRCLAKLLTDMSSLEELHAVCMFPCYQSLSEVLPLSGITMSKWCLKPCPDTNQWSLSLTELKDLIQTNTRIIVVNLPHNPTGYLPTKEWLDELISICRERNIFLFSDEIYRFLVHDNLEQLPPASSLYENAITLSGLSKCFGVPGIRCGWLATRNMELYKLCIKYKSYTTICANVIGEKIAITVLKLKDAILKRQMTFTGKNLDSLEEFFKRHDDKFIWRRPQASTMAFVELREDFKKRVGCATKLCDYLIKQDLLILPSATMLMEDDKHLRFGFGRKNFESNLQKFEEVLSKMPESL